MSKGKLVVSSIEMGVCRKRKFYLEWIPKREYTFLFHVSQSTSDNT